MSRDNNSNSLYLVLFKNWFDQILSGKKKTEYREIQPFWTRKLFNTDGTPRHYDNVLFSNGYGRHRPRMKIEFLGVTRGERHYEIHLGKIIESSNISIADR